MTQWTRREWLALGAFAVAAPLLPAIEPIVRTGKSRMKLSLAAYSFRQRLDLNRKPAPTMTLADLIDYAAEQGIDAVELTAYYFPETSPPYLAELRSRCVRQGIEISGTAIGNNYCNPATLKDELARTRAWIEHTARLGGKTMRIFAGTVVKGEDEDRARRRCVEAIEESCQDAARHGIYLALENHGGITATADQLLAIVQAVKAGNFGVNLDTGNFHTDDPYADLARVAPYAVNVQLKTEIFPKGKKAEEADLSRLVELLRKVRYSGYVALEYEAEEDAERAVPRYLDELRKLLAG